MSRFSRSQRANPEQPGGPHRRMALSHSLSLELGWTIGPAVVILAIAISIFQTILVADPSGALPAPSPTPVQEELLEESGAEGSPEREVGNGANAPG